MENQKTLSIGYQTKKDLLDGDAFESVADSFKPITAAAAAAAAAAVNVRHPEYLE